MIKKEILQNDALQQHALFFSPDHHNNMPVSEVLRLEAEEARLTGKEAPPPLKLPDFSSINPAARLNRGSKLRYGAVVHEDGSVTFNIPAPNAKKVEVCGIGGKMSTDRIPMEKSEDGLWTVTVSGIGKGFIYHDFFVDGNRTINELEAIGYGCGRPMNFVEIPDNDSEFWLLQDVPHGSVRMELFYSKVLQKNRMCYVYTPPGYDGGSKEYPVLYIQHGGGENETGWLWQGKINYIMENLLAKGEAEEMLIVMNDGNCIGDTPETKDACYTTMLIEDCIPFLEGKFRIKKGRNYRALAGLSFGAINSQVCIYNNPDKFANLGVFSGAFKMEALDETFPDLFPNPDRVNEVFDVLFVSWGDDEGEEASMNTVEAYRRRGINIHSFHTPGYHEWDVWKQASREYLKLLFKKG